MYTHIYMYRPHGIGLSMDYLKEFRSRLVCPSRGYYTNTYTLKFNTLPGSPGNRGANPLVLKLARGNRKLLNIIKDD